MKHIRVDGDKWSWCEEKAPHGMVSLAEAVDSAILMKNVGGHNGDEVCGPCVFALFDALRNIATGFCRHCGRATPPTCHCENDE